MDQLNKYQNGKIYILKSNQTNKVYIGSTTRTLKQRFHAHKYANTTNSKILLDGYNDVKIELLELYPCNNKIELLKKEGEYIKKYKDTCINIKCAGRLPIEYYYDNQLDLLNHQKEYRKNNKELIRLQQKEYYQKRKSMSLIQSG